MGVVLEWFTISDSSDKKALVKWICLKQSYDPGLMKWLCPNSKIEVWMEQNYFSVLCEGLNFISQSWRGREAEKENFQDAALPTHGALHLQWCSSTGLLRT